MEITWLDFLTGFFLMNAMPHLIFGLYKIRMLSAFGYSPQGNLAYFVLNIVIALTLFHIQHGLQILFGNGIILGALAVLLIYLVSGKFFYNLFQKEPATAK